MSILAANLKHFYQRRAAWLWSLMILCLIPMVCSVRSKPERYLGYLFISCLMGQMVGSFQKEILSKPFSFCLPGHNGIPRRFIVWVGLVVNGMLGFVFIFHLGLGFPSVFLVVLAGATAGMMVYLLCAGLMLFNLEKNKLGWFLMPITFYGYFSKWDLVVQEVIVTSPLIATSLGLLSCWLIWRWLGTESLRRKYCGKTVIGMFDGWNKEKMSKVRQARLAERDKKKPGFIKISSDVERFFISRISGATTDSLRPYVWGGLYKTFGMMISQRRQGLMKSFLFILPALCLLGYMGPGRHFIFFMPGIIVTSMSLNVRSSLLISGSRRERFWSALTLAATTAMLITIAAVLFAMATHLLERIMPQLSVKGHELTFSSMNMDVCLVPLVMIPVALIIGLVVQKNRVLKMVLIMILFQILFVFSMFKKPESMNWLVQIGPVYVMIIFLCCWGLFVAVLRRISMRCCLVGQTK